MEIIAILDSTMELIRDKAPDMNLEEFSMVLDKYTPINYGAVLYFTPEYESPWEFPMEISTAVHQPKTWAIITRPFLDTFYNFDRSCAQRRFVEVTKKS